LKPFGRLPQLPFSHRTPGAHWLSLAHEVRHMLVVASHEKGEHTIVPPSRHAPSPSQMNVPSNAAPLHVPLPHMEPRW
jgi:hypothetical protein